MGSLCLGLFSMLICFVTLFTLYAAPGRAQSTDASVMQDLKKSLGPGVSSLGWVDSDPCNWKNVQCTKDTKRVTRIQIGNKGLQGGSLPPNLNKLASLEVFEVMGNGLTGSLPTFSGLNSLQSILLNNNGFTSVPPDFFDGMTSLQAVYLDSNPFKPWAIPESIKSASTLQTFSANNASLSGPIPDFFGPDTFSSLTDLHLSSNYLEGPLPDTFVGSSIQTLWLNGQHSPSKLNGSVSILLNMTQLNQVWLHQNSFTGPLPSDFSGLTQLKEFSIRDNSFTGPVPDSLVGLKTLASVNLTNNMLQGPTPKFGAIRVDMLKDTNSFCLPDPGVACDYRVDILLSFAHDVGYPKSFAQNWKGNDPCAARWIGITCSNGNITVVNFPRMGLTGTISPRLSELTSLQTLVLSGNYLTGTIPEELTKLPNLREVDVSDNQLYGKVPLFGSNVKVKTIGNVNIGKDAPPPSSQGGKRSGGSPGASDGGAGESGSRKKKSSTGVVVGSVIGGVCAVAAIGVLILCHYRSRAKRSGRVQPPHSMVIHPGSSGSGDAVKITIADSNLNGGTSDTLSHISSGQSDIHIVEAGNMVISIQVLKSVTNQFSPENILGRGGFGTVYKGELHDGTKIAVKRMESGVITDKGLDEFKSEIAVLTKVRHRHLVALLGYCLDGNERLLVYEYMPQGPLSRYLFHWKEEGLKPLEWKKRLTIALDVARGVEYLHSLAQHSFIHRDLKPSNILLGDDLRAKVADFGLVRLAPDNKASIATKLAGTFGYLAPEYAATGRVSIKIDVFSFGIILMEMITGRRALDETLPDESQHLVMWFRRALINKDTFQKAIDPTIDLDEETLASISKVAELAGHCCAWDPAHRPDMAHAVNVLSSLAELWKPAEVADPDDAYGIDYEMTLPQTVKKWQALEGMTGFDESSSNLGSNDNTQTSIPTRPSGFADSFTSADGR